MLKYCLALVLCAMLVLPLSAEEPAAIIDISEAKTAFLVNRAPTWR